MSQSSDNVEKVECVNCGRSMTFAKGTLSVEGLTKFRCPNCTTATLESNVQAQANKGRRLITED